MHISTSNTKLQFKCVIHRDNEWTELEVPIDYCNGKRTGLEVPIINHCPPWECMASSHCWRAASWPTRPVRTLCMVARTLRRVSQTAKESRSSRSCVASNGSKWCINPSGAVLTGVDAPAAPPPARGGGMMNTSR